MNRSSMQKDMNQSIQEHKDGDNLKSSEKSVDQLVSHLTDLLQRNMVILF
jgi:hypothetical protein